MSRKRRKEEGLSPTGRPTRPISEPPSERRRYFWLLIPLSWILILTTLEGGLRLAGFGYRSDLFEPVQGGMLVDNSDYLRRFYSLYDRAEPVQKSNFFPVEKQPGRLRIFVVGASTAQGFPFQRNHSFSAIAQAGLRASGVDVEVLNVGNSAMTSYYLREVLQDLPAYEPDFVAIYAGHNEYYGTPSMFTGGNHPIRLAVLRLRKFRTVQAIEHILALALKREVPTSTLMERRFAEGLFPVDSARDTRVAELFIQNLDSGLAPLRSAGVDMAIFQPVSNLIDMPPFREAASPAPASTQNNDARTAADGGVSVKGVPLISEFQRLRRELDQGRWNRDAWVALKDRDAAPFRARSSLTEMLEQYATSSPGVAWIDTADQLEEAGGPTAFSHELFIDHLHFNFEGQLLLARLLGRAVLAQLRPEDEAALEAFEEYLSDPDRVRADIHLTGFWEFEAYTRVATLQTQEPFASMPLAKSAPPVPERVQRNSLFAGGNFVDSLRQGEEEDLLFVALDHYLAAGDRDEWIRNMNAYVHVYPGHYQSHLAYAVALLQDDARANIDLAGTYARRAYSLSGQDPEVANVVRQALVNAGLGALWISFESRYLGGT